MHSGGAPVALEGLHRRFLGSYNRPHWRRMVAAEGMDQEDIVPGRTALEEDKVRWDSAPVKGIGLAEDIRHTVVDLGRSKVDRSWSYCEFRKNCRMNLQRKEWA
jgi:hypothetical protein